MIFRRAGARGDRAPAVSPTGGGAKLTVVPDDRGHDRSFVSFAEHHGTRHRAFTDGTGLVLTATTSCVLDQLRGGRSPSAGRPAARRGTRPARGGAISLASITRWQAGSISPDYTAPVGLRRIDFEPAWTYTRKIAALGNTQRLDGRGLLEKLASLDERVGMPFVWFSTACMAISCAAARWSGCWRLPSGVSSCCPNMTIGCCTVGPMTPTALE